MEKPKEYTIDYSGFEVTSNEITSSIGYSGQEIPEMVRQNIHDIRKEVGKHCQIRGGFRIINNIQVRDNQLNLAGVLFHTEKIIASSVKKANSIAIFVCTAGEELSNLAGLFFENNDPVKAYITDITASLIVEKAADQLAGYIEETVSADQKQITNRYSPGYCGWHVSEQHKLFGLLPDNFCGVRLNEAALMSPIKSVSGIIGIGQNVKKTAYQCNKCDKSDCLLSYKQ